MPVQSPPTKKSSIVVHRSESLRSEVSDASQQSKRVSFNRDVHVKRIPRGSSAVVDRNGKLVAVLDGASVGSGNFASGSGGGGSGGGGRQYSRNSDTSSPNGRLWVNSLVPSKEALPEEELLREAETILKHVDSVTCSSSSSLSPSKKKGAFDNTRSTLERSKSSVTNGTNNNNKNKAIKLVQKSPSRLSDFFSKTLPSHLKNKYQQSKSTQNLVAASATTTATNGVHNNVHNIEPKSKLKQSVSRELSNGSSLNSSILISKSEPNLYNGNHIHQNGNGKYKKVAKIKKPHGTRVALNSIGETPTNTSSSGGSGHNSSSSGSVSDNNSGSDSNNSLPKNLKVSTSDSPVSSLSGPEESPNIMANSLGRDNYNQNHNNHLHQNRVSSIVQQLSNRRVAAGGGGGQESPERHLNNIPYHRSPVVEPSLLLSGGNTHNNNQPFSYITGGAINSAGSNSNNNNIERGRSPAKNIINPSTKTTTTTPLGSSSGGKILPKEVIYAQVVCSGGEPGVPAEKRTVHTTVNTNGTTTTTSNGVTPSKDSRSSPPRKNSSNNNHTELNGHNNNSSVSPNSIQHFVYENSKSDKGGGGGKKNPKINGITKNNDDTTMNHNNSFRTGGYNHHHRSAYDDFDFSGAKPRNNVTTVLLNNVDDDDTSFSSSRHNSYNNYNGGGPNYRNRSPSPSPNFRKPEQSFYFGSPSRLTSSNNNHDHHNNYSSSSFNYKSPRIHHHDYSSSREVSPAAKAVSSALLVRDAERKKDSIVSSAKLVSAFGHHNNHNHQSNNMDYDSTYNSLKLGNHNDDDHHLRDRRTSPNRITTTSSSSRLTNGHNNNTSSLPKSKYSSSFDHSNHHHHQQHDLSSTSRSNKKIKIVGGGGGSKTSTPNASNSSVNKLGLRSKEHSPVAYGRGYSKSKSPEKNISTLRRSADNSLERKYNRKNKEDEQKQQTTTTTTTTTTSNNNTGGSGLISTLMRRNKDKKIQKEAAKEKERKEAEENSPPETQGSKESKIKRQRAKFLSAFLDKNFPSRNKNSTTQPQQTSATTTTTTTATDKKSSLLVGKNNKPTDSEIEEAERRRDGEYHSWSSGDDDYRFGHHRNGQLTRGKSYNFGDLNEESGTKPWYDQNDSDYRREMATSGGGGGGGGGGYTSATLGSSRPRMRSSGHESDNLRSKSLDRRAYKNRVSPPRIMVTPNTPAVEETDKWKSTYDPIIRSFDRDRIHHNGGGGGHGGHHHHSTLSKKMSGLSKSSYELDDHHGDRERGPSSGSSSKLRYFGDTDAEDLSGYQNGTHSSYLSKNHHGGGGGGGGGHGKFIPRSSSYLSRAGKDNYHSKYYTVPGSSLNSSGSEHGSRMSKGSSNAGSQRSVYLHAPAVADIPPTGMQRRTLSRDELSNHSGSQKQTKHLARSMSVLAPWRPRHYREKYEVNYNNESKENQPYGRPPKPPRSPARKSMSPGRAGSTESLLKSSDDKRENSPLRSSTLGRTKENVKISRSKSMPKDTRLFAGWLRRFGKESKS